MFNASFPKTLVSLQLFRDTMDVSRIFLHQVGEEWIPYRMFTMQLHNNKVANPLYQMQRVWIAVPAVDRGSSDLFKMMNIFFNNPKLKTKTRKNRLPPKCQERRKLANLASA